VAEDEHAFGWMVEVTRRGASHVCPQCTREHSRAIEGKLDQEWW
jgi:hypothetical protein